MIAPNNQLTPERLAALKECLDIYEEIPTPCQKNESSVNIPKYVLADHAPTIRALLEEREQRRLCTECMRPDGWDAKQLAEANRDCICGGVGTLKAQMIGYRECIKFHQSNYSTAKAAGAREAYKAVRAWIAPRYTEAKGYGFASNVKDDVLHFLDAREREAQS